MGNERGYALPGIFAVIISDMQTRLEWTRRHTRGLCTSTTSIKHLVSYIQPKNGRYALIDCSLLHFAIEWRFYDVGSCSCQVNTSDSGANIRFREFLSLSCVIRFEKML
jgi:hypothetical protein